MEMKMEIKKIRLIKICLFVFFLFNNFMSYAQNITLETKDGIQHSFEATDDTLRIERLPQPVNKILEKKINPKKVIFSFLNLENVDAGFWESFSDVEIFIFDFVYLKDLRFLNKLTNAKVICFAESIWIKNLSEIDFSNNKKLEYFEIYEVDLTAVKEIKNLPETLKYLAIVHCKLNDSILKKSDNKKVIYVIDKRQLKYVSDNYIFDTNLPELWDQYKIKRKK